MLLGLLSKGIRLNANRWFVCNHNLDKFVACGAPTFADLA